MKSSDSKIFIVQEAPTNCTKSSFSKKLAKVNTSNDSNQRFCSKNGLMYRNNRHNQSNEEHGFRYINGLYGILALIIMIGSTFSLTLLPTHNAIARPDCWYEFIFSSSFPAFFLTASNAMGAYTAMNPFKKRMIAVFFDLFLTFMVTETLLVCVVHLIWSVILGYFEPFPKKWSILAYPLVMVGLIRLWNLISCEKRLEPTFRKKCKAYIFYILWILVTAIQLNGIMVVLAIVPVDIQWVCSLLVPLTKEFNDIIAEKLITKSALPENIQKAQLMAKIVNDLVYSYWFAYQATTATMTTNYFLLGINFCLNMALCRKIIRLHRKVSTTDLDRKKKECLKQEAVTELLVHETIEIMVPIAFIGTFATAFYGPNKHNLATAGCSIWAFQEAEDFSVFVTPVVKIALIDSGSLILAAGLLFKFCKIDILREFCKTMKNIWMNLGLWGGNMITGVSLIKI